MRSCSTSETKRFRFCNECTGRCPEQSADTASKASQQNGRIIRFVTYTNLHEPNVAATTEPAGITCWMANLTKFMHTVMAHLQRASTVVLSMLTTTRQTRAAPIQNQAVNSGYGPMAMIMFQEQTPKSAKAVS